LGAQGGSRVLDTSLCVLQTRRRGAWSETGKKLYRSDAKALGSAGPLGGTDGAGALIIEWVCRSQNGSVHCQQALTLANVHVRDDLVTDLNFADFRRRWTNTVGGFQLTRRVSVFTTESQSDVRGSALLRLIADCHQYLGDQKLPVEVPRVRNVDDDREISLAACQTLQTPRNLDEGLFRRMSKSIATRLLRGLC